MEVLGFLLGTLFFILLEAFFAGSEIALVSVDKGKVLSLYRRTKQDFLKDFHDNPEEYITLTMLGYTISIVFASTFYTLAVLQLSEYFPIIKGFEVILSSTLVIFTLLLGEILPKSLYQKHAERLFFPSLWILSKLRIFTKPLLVFARVISRFITDLLKDKYKEKLEKEDLIKLMEEISSKEESLRIAMRIISSKYIFITEEIKPIQEVVMVEENTNIERVMEIMKKNKYRRLPVYSGKMDNIVGYVDLFDLIQSKHATSIKELTRPIHFFSEFTTIEKAFEVFKKSKEQMAVVGDERGNLLGIITWDDLQGYIIGGLSEGTKEEEEDFVEIEKGKWIVDGGVEREKFERFFNLKLPEGPYNTLGGFLCFYLGRIPEKGYTIEYQGYRFKVVQRDNKRVIKVMVESHVPQD